MVRRALLATLLLFGGILLYADLAETMARVDALDEEEKNEEALQVLEAALAGEASGANKAEVYWRMARATLNLGDAAERSGQKGAPLLAIFEKGERYGQQAIDADPNNFHGYYWKSANVGRWGQIKGVLNSLFRAGDMQKLLSKAVSLCPTDKGSFYVLGQLYDQVPGFPISYGNIEYAVSLGRKSVYLMEIDVRSGVEKSYDFDYYTELAKHLYGRNWSTEKRTKVANDNKAKLSAARDELTRGFYYESSVSLAGVSDREEARSLAQKAIDGLQALPRRSAGEEADLKEARETLAGFR